MRFLRLLVLAIPAVGCLSLTATPAAAQEPHSWAPVSQHLDTETGLAQNRVSTLAQDAWGRVWLGTQDGINVLDGNEIRTLRGGGRDGGLRSAIVNDLEAGPDVAMWAATDAGVDRIDLRTMAVSPLADAGSPAHSLHFIDDHR